MVLSLLVLGLACTRSAAPGDDVHALLVAAGCSDGASQITDVAHEVTDIPTVLRVSWQTDGAGPGAVWFVDANGETVVASDLTESDVHEVLLRGIRARTTVDFVVTTTVDGAVQCSPVQTGETDALPQSLPTITLGIWDPAQSSGSYTAVAVLAESNSYAIVIDQEGEVVWVQELDQYGLLRTAISVDATAILYNEPLVTGPDEEPGTSYHRVGWDGASLAQFDIAGGHTDFTERSDGTIATLGWDLYVYEEEDRQIMGDNLIEIAPDGTTTELWTVWDYFEPDLSESYPTNTGIGQPGTEDWTHANGLSYEDGAYYVSIPGIESVVRIDAATGAMDWTLSDAMGDFTISGDEPVVDMPHSAHPTPDGMLIFNRGALGDVSTCSEATWITLDTDNWTAEATNHYTSEDCILVPMLGEAVPLTDDHTLVVWSTAGQIDEVSATGETVWRVNLDLGAAFGFGHRVQSLYP